MSDAAAELPGFEQLGFVRALNAPTPAEIEGLADLFDRYRAHYVEGVDASQSRRWLQRNIGSGRLDAFVAESDGELVGFAITMDVPASLRLGHFWQIRDLFVVPHRRRLGVARALLDHIRSAATAAGALRLVLQTELDNTSALRLYEEKRSRGN